MSKFHIGKKIKEVIDKSHYTIIAFAESINLTRDGAYKIFKKETIDTEQLQKISKVLNHDFFSYYNQGLVAQAKDIKPDYGYATKDELLSLTHSVQALAKEIEKLREELPKKKAAPKKKYGKKK